MGGVNFERSSTPAGTLRVALAGDFVHGKDMPDLAALPREFEAGQAPQRVEFDTAALGQWDMTLMPFLRHAGMICAERDIELDVSGLPDGLRRLLDLASRTPPKKTHDESLDREQFFARVGNEVLNFVKSTGEMLAFMGVVLISMGKMFRGRAQCRRSDLLAVIQECGAQALPIVSLIGLLMGLILAFIGGVQLRLFGAEIYTASLVGIGMVRVLGAVMTGIIMAGRTGAAFAAQLGTMQVNEEIDALETLGISPIDFLVLPRMLALILMMPLLTLYADVMGVIGGAIVGVGLFGIELRQYYNQTVVTLSLTQLWVGLFHAVVFGVLVAVAGCLRGMQCGRSASAVGDATTSAVVTGIVSIVVATAVITVVLNGLGI
jgi:phospholipid/cholesterol/gamma-HCH transport system permease protein